MFSVGNPATLSCFNLPNLTFTDMQNCKSQQDTKEVVFTKFAGPASVWMLLPSTMTLQNWDQSLQSFLTDQAWEQNADDGAGVNRAECRPPLPSSIAPGAAVITAPNSRDRHRRRHKWFRDKKRWLFKAASENSEQSTGVVWGNPPTFTHIVTPKQR